MWGKNPDRSQSIGFVDVSPEKDDDSGEKICFQHCNGPITIDERTGPIATTE